MWTHDLRNGVDCCVWSIGGYLCGPFYQKNSSVDGHTGDNRSRYGERTDKCCAWDSANRPAECELYTCQVLSHSHSKPASYATVYPAAH